MIELEIINQRKTFNLRTYWTSEVIRSGFKREIPLS